MTGRRTRDEVRIVEIRGLHVACRLPEAQGNASGWYDTRGSLVIELRGSNGLSGWGETWHSPRAAAGTIRESLANAVLGCAASAPRSLRTELLARRGYDRAGVASMAISALEMACWDLAARSEQRSIASLLGGPVRTRVPAYAAGPYFKPGGDPYRDYAREAESYARSGFQALKAKIGRGAAEDAVAVAGMRSAVGPAFGLMVDANQGCTARSAMAIAQRLAEHELVWFEEPVPPENLKGYRDFVRNVPMAAAGGEAGGELHAFADLIATGIDIVEPDLSICGGFAAALEVATLAQASGIATVPHVWGTGINLYATLQLLAVLPHAPGTGPWPYPWLELDRSPNPLRTLWGEPCPDGNGMVSIPDGAGIGLDLRAEDFERYVVDRWSITE
jgi:D-galactarolactone cycloisomerase